MLFCEERRPGRKTQDMKVSEWLDEQVANRIDVSHIDIPMDILYEDQPDETIYYEEINTCSILCRKNHPFSTVERFGDWYYARGQDKEAGPHSSQMKWKLLTKDKQLALHTAKRHIE